MASNDQYKEINKKIIEILQNLLAAGDWNASLFLRAAHKKLQALADQAASLSEQFDQKAVTSPDQKHKDRMKQGYIKVYVSIYQSDPYNLTRWENTLKSIREYSINRPIYRSEEHIQEAIRSKQGSANEAYVAVYIKESDIIRPYAGKMIEDRWGHELLTLRDTALLPGNIIEFDHQGKKYEFVNGKLLLKSDISQ
jgi:intracellular multiplication protein IcmQ